MAKYRKYLLLAMFLVALTIGLCEAQETYPIRIEGFVYGPDGTPLKNASVRLWGFYLDGETQTDQDGHYEIHVTTTEVSIQLFALYDNPATEAPIKKRPDRK
jgi:protocatechuate 3,4-dioxygenase beta subunit